MQTLIRFHLDESMPNAVATERQRTIGQMVGALATMRLEFTAEDLHGQVRFL